MFAVWFSVCLLYWCLGFVCDDGLLAGISLFLVCELQVGWVVRFEVFYGLVVISWWSVCGYLFSLCGGVFLLVIGVAVDWLGWVIVFLCSVSCAWLLIVLVMLFSFDFCFLSVCGLLL